jgi:hypothetical protein
VNGYLIRYRVIYVMLNETTTVFINFELRVLYLNLY